MGLPLTLLVVMGAWHCLEARQGSNWRVKLAHHKVDNPSSPQCPEGSFEGSSPLIPDISLQCLVKCPDGTCVHRYKGELCKYRDNDASPRALLAPGNTSASCCSHLDTAPPNTSDKCGEYHNHTLSQYDSHLTADGDDVNKVPDTVEIYVKKLNTAQLFTLASCVKVCFSRPCGKYKYIQPTDSKTNKTATVCNGVTVQWQDEKCYCTDRKPTSDRSLSDVPLSLGLCDGSQRNATLRNITQVLAKALHDCEKHQARNTVAPTTKLKENSGGINDNDKKNEDDNKMSRTTTSQDVAYTETTDGTESTMLTPTQSLWQSTVTIVTANIYIVIVIIIIAIIIIVFVLIITKKYSWSYSSVPQMIMVLNLSL